MSWPTFTYEASGRPASVVLGNPSTGPRYYYVYNGHGDVVALTDSSGTVVASYQYDAFGVLTSSSENFPNGWSNPYRFDGADLVRYDGETGLYWMSVRAYDPALGRFISHDPLGRLAAEGIDFAPYVYTDNNPVMNVDPSGQRYVCAPDGCGGSDCPSGQQWNGQKCVTPPTKTSPPPVTPPGNGSGCHGGGPRVCTGGTNPCPAGMSPSNNHSCVYDNGECIGRTIDGCNEQKQSDAKIQQIARGAAMYFQRMANVFQNATAPWWLNLIGAASGINAIFGALAGIAEIYAQGFAALAKGQGDLDAEISGNGSMGNAASSQTLKDIVIAMGIGAGSLLLPDLGDALAASDSRIAAFFGGRVAQIGLFGPIGASVVATGIWIGSYIFENQYDDYLGQIEQEVFDAE